MPGKGGKARRAWRNGVYRARRGSKARVKRRISGETADSMAKRRTAGAMRAEKRGRNGGYQARCGGKARVKRQTVGAAWEQSAGEMADIKRGVGAKRGRGGGQSRRFCRGGPAAGAGLNSGLPRGEENFRVGARKMFAAGRGAPSPRGLGAGRGRPPGAAA